MYGILRKFGQRGQPFFASLCQTRKNSLGSRFVVLVGAPGVGKGMFAEMLAKDLQLNKISPGEEIRKIIKNKTRPTLFDPETVELIQKSVSAGGLVSDDLVFKIIQEKLKEPQSKKGVVLDDFPRTMLQLARFDKQYPIHLAINLKLRDDILLERLLGRRTCVNCGAPYFSGGFKKDGYEVEGVQPAHEGICDKCGGKLAIKKDDSPEVIQARIKDYEEKIKSVLDEFRKRQILMEFEGKRGLKDYPKLLETVKSLLAQVK